MRFLRIFLVVIQIGLLMLGLVFAFFSRNLPDIEIITEIKLTNPMRVYTKDKKLIGQFGTEKREIIKTNGYQIIRCSYAYLVIFIFYFLLPRAGAGAGLIRRSNNGKMINWGKNNSIIS